MFDKILILTPNTDDGEFGCGGSIARFIEEKREVYYCAFSTARALVPDGYPENILEIEVREAAKTLGISTEHLIVFQYQVRKLNYVRQEILEELVKIRSELQPDLVLLPSSNDIHQDHFTVSTEGLRAFKQTTLLGYELPWNTITFHAQAFIKLEKRHIERKVEALKAYQSQSRKQYATEEFLWAWAKMRGTQVGMEFAETMEVVRWVV
jgi:LmbE family N-acetylglucosaminyl deacetylase